jgi:hypothetical protein
MTGQTNEAQWYIARDGKQHGPLTDVEMRTFVGHSYLRPSDLLWRPGMPDWQPAPQVFPAAFQQPQPAPAPQPIGPQAPAQAPAPQEAAQQRQPAGYAQPQGTAPVQQQQRPQPAQFDAGPAQAQPGAQYGAPQASPYGDGQFEEEKPKRGILKQAVIALLAIAVIGGGAFGIVMYKDKFTQLVSGPAKKADEPAIAAAPTDTEAAPAEEQQTAAVEEQPALPESDSTGPDMTAIDGSAIDARLQKVPLWEMLKKDYPEWYIGNVAAAEKLSSEQKPALEVTTQLVQGLVDLRRQKAPNALAASPEKLKSVATAFLENLRSLQAQSVGACYGFISKGELSPAVIEIMQSPESATAINAQLSAIFEAAAEGAKAPVKHESAGKADYDVLIAELSKLGWKEEDLQVFSNPRLLAKREPAQVCKMVQDWFSAHLAVPDAAAQDRLLYETLKPVVSG